MNRAAQTNKAVIIILAVVLLGLIGYFFWQTFVRADRGIDNNISEVSSPVEESIEGEAEDDSDEMPIEEGTITGSLTYPSEGIPPSVEIHAYNIDTQQDFFVKDHINDSKFQYGVGYEITVPAGRYYVYAVTPEMPDHKAYYNEYVRCGMSVGCTDLANIEVTVEASEATENVTVGDWYNVDTTE